MNISASILSADFTNLQQEILALEDAGVDMLHIDIMDGHFVPNLTFGPMVLATIRKLTNLPLDVHLMINRPELVVDQYVSSGADIITIHPESTIHLDRTLNLIKREAKVGIALLPSTSPDVIDYVINIIDLVLVMTVNPGFAGQAFLPSQMSKIKIIADKIQQNNSKALLSVDGGINANIAADCVRAGANSLVVGSFIFANYGAYRDKIMQLRTVM